MASALPRLGRPKEAQTAPVPLKTRSGGGRGRNCDGRGLHLDDD